MENNADELKTKIGARWNKQVSLGCPIGRIQDTLVKTCQLPVVQGDTDGSFIPIHKHIHQCWEVAIGTILSEQMGALYHHYDWTWTFTTWLVLCCVWTAASRTTKNRMLARNTSCNVNFTLHQRQKNQGLWRRRIWRRWGWPGWWGWCCCGPCLSRRGGLEINTLVARSLKSCFSKDSQVQNACIFASFRKYAFAEILRFRKL